jgi:hypothetical protein
MLKRAGLVQAVAAMFEDIGAIRDRLNEADAKLGDGDTGMTVERVIRALHNASVGLPADIGAALGTYSRQCALATGSSLGSVTAIGLSAAARSARGGEAVDRAGIVKALRAATEAITERSGAAPGDKTVLDSLLEIQEYVEASDTSVSLSDIAIGAARSALERFRPCQSRLGTARVYGAKSAGLDDPGMLAVYLLLEAGLRPRRIA